MSSEDRNDAPRSRLQRHPQGQQRVGRATLLHDEACEQDRRSGEQDQHLGRGPAQAGFCGLGGAVDEGDEAAADEGGTGQVVAVALGQRTLADHAQGSEAATSAIGMLT